MNHVDLKALATAVCAISDNHRRRQVCQAMGEAHATGDPFFDWHKWRDACNVPTASEARPPHLEDPGAGFIQLTRGTATDKTYLLHLARLIASLDRDGEREDVCQLIGAAYAQANHFFNARSWAEQCHVCPRAEVLGA